jgi:uncharacterized protein YcfJ
MKRTTTLLASLALALAGEATAGSSYARVLSSSPIYDRVASNEEVCYHREARRDRGTEGAILGAIVGGALGNQVGKGDGRKAATVAGAVAGAVIGRDIDRRDRHNYVCDYRPVYRDVIIGYDVTYRYKGRAYQDQIPYRPGRRIPVIVYNSRGRVDVRAADRLM